MKSKTIIIIFTYFLYYSLLYTNEFLKIHKFEDRLQESTRIKNKYPERIPIICENIKIMILYQN